MNLSFLQFIWKNNCGNGVPTIKKLWERRSQAFPLEPNPAFLAVLLVTQKSEPKVDIEL